MGNNSDAQHLHDLSKTKNYALFLEWREYISNLSYVQTECKEGIRLKFQGKKLLPISRTNN